ncbi:MAG TPA: glucose 1-dehydrogenase [Geminicoccaceae bacterium]|nr:glucose 1-dehydrogenase [Geminicoccaceae bacterium]
MQLEGKVAIVTGAAGGIGRGIAQCLAAEGATVLIADIDAARAEATAAALAATGLQAHPRRLDVRDPEDAAAAVAHAVERFGRLDILVNNAGSTARRPFLDMPLDFFEDLIRLNLTGTFVCAQAAARRMARRNAGRIVNISSNSGIFGGAGRAAYSASKAGIIALPQSMAIELAPFGILVNCVAPGPTRTERTTTPEPTPAFTTRMSLKRYAEPAEIGKAVAFLCSDACTFTTGHTLCVDGGLTVTGIMDP